MGVVEQASEAIENCLDRLEEAYSTFPINQTTLAVATDRYETIRADDEEIVDLHAKVHDENGDILHVRDGKSLKLPGIRAEAGEGLEATMESAVEESTGVSCQMGDVEKATIIGVRDADDAERDTVYRLAVVFEGVSTGGVPSEGTVWESSAVSLQHA